MVFYILSPHKIEAIEYEQDEFVADDLLQAIQSGMTKIATTEHVFDEMKQDYPNLLQYKVKVEKVSK